MLEYDRQAIRRLRAKEGLTYREFGNKVGMKPQQVQALEVHPGHPNLRTLLRVANGFSVGFGVFLKVGATARADEM